MYKNTNRTITLEYDENLISKLKEMIEDGWEKLKSFVKSKTKQFPIYNEEPNLDFYNELKERFKEISLTLKEIKLCEELNIFLSISHLISYIVYENSVNASFGHCCFAVDLLKFFIDLFKTNIQYYTNPHEIRDYEKIQEKYRKMHFEYTREFYWNIYQPDDEYDEEKMYKIAKTLGSE